MHLNLVSLTGLPLAFTFCPIPLCLPCARSVALGMWVVWNSLVFAIICASFTNSICERLFLAPTCGVYLLKSLLNSWLVPQFFVCCKQNFNLQLSKLHFLVHVLWPRLLQSDERSLGGAVKLLVFTVFSALTEWITSMIEVVWESGGLGWRHTTLPPTHSHTHRLTLLTLSSVSCHK